MLSLYLHYRKPRSHNHYDGYKTDLAKAIYRARKKHRGPVNIKKINHTTRRGKITGTREVKRSVNFRKHGALFRN